MSKMKVALMIKISRETAEKRLNMWFQVFDNFFYFHFLRLPNRRVNSKAQVLLLSCCSLTLTNSPPSILHFKQEQCMLMLSPFEACFTPGESFPQDPLIFLYLCHYCLTGLCVQSFFAPYHYCLLSLQYFTLWTLVQKEI